MEHLEKQKKLLQRISAAKPEICNFNGTNIWCLPNVFYPHKDTILLAETALARIRPDETILEPCAGSGYITVILAKKASSMTATDINPDSVKNIKENVILHEFIDKVEVIECDLFPEDGKKYDVIVINPPYTDNPISNVVERSVWDPGHATLNRFLDKAKDHLTEQGRIYLSWADFADFDFIEKTTDEKGYAIQKINESDIYRVYELIIRE
ncbi:methyltransferase [Candidatus Woesearchaeota archaeon]|nr:methyltransferase [Candidatus Woesearchaeota archaeon]